MKKIDLNSWIRGAVGALCFASISASAQAAPAQVAPAAPVKRPNVLFVALDDLRPAIGAYGDPLAITPNMDALAARGTLFQQAFCQQAVCAASRNSLLTGLRPDSIGIYNLGTFFRTRVPNVVTLPQYFKNNGYHSEAIGKIYHPGHGNHDDALSWSVPSRRFDGTLQPVASEAPKPRDPNARRPAPFAAPDVPDSELEDGKIANLAIESLGRLKAQTQPFFLAVGFAKPHLPFVAPKKYWDLFDRARFQVPEPRTMPIGTPPYAGENSGELRLYDGIPKDGPVSDDLARELMHGYYAATSYADAQLGRVMSELDRLGLRDNTIIVLWGDHGFNLGELGLWTKSNNFEEAAHAPLIVSAPNQSKPGAQTMGLVEFVDIYPSLCDLAGLPRPSHLEGQSFVPLMENPGRIWKRAVFHQWPKLERNVTLRGMGHAIRTDRYRLVEWEVNPELGQNSVELYDLLRDPHETRNLATDGEFAPLVAELRGRLKNGWRSERASE